MHYATAITTSSANQRPNTPCIWLWIDVTFRGHEHSYSHNFLNKRDGDFGLHRGFRI